VDVFPGGKVVEFFDLVVNLVDLFASERPPEKLSCGHAALSHRRAHTLHRSNYI
jgi:hypothetical protein